MKNFIPIIMLLVLGSFSFVRPESPPLNVVELPIEVMGEDGTIESVELIASSGSSAVALQLGTHAISYMPYLGYTTRKASIRLNGGSWVDIDNSSATCPLPEHAAASCAEGALGYLRLQIVEAELGTFVDGSNTLDFRFNYEGGDISSGYRILYLDLLDSDGESLLTGTTFTDANPSSWSPPESHPDSIAAGETLWHARDILIDGFGGPEISAACADCHATDGRDLRYFNYSNKAIRVRSEFHGLSEQQGDLIASFIRDYDLESRYGASYESKGRPWYPPYQPGPGLSTDSVYNWAAGAGLVNILERDSSILGHMFPDFPNTGDVINLDSSLNLVEIPISLQLPDWNEWTTFVWPGDVWGATFTGGAVPTELASLIARIDTPEEVATEVANGTLGARFDGFFDDCKDFARDEDVPSGYNSQQSANAYLGLYQWCLVKTWELMHYYSLEDYADEIYDHGERRSWLGLNARNFFNVAPHIHGPSKGPQGTATNTYFDTAWYELQMLMNHGNRETTALKPVDWKYHFAHIGDYYKDAGIAQPFRYLRAYLRVLQNARFLETSGTNEIEFRHVSIARVYKLITAGTGKNVLGTLDDVRPGLEQKFAIGLTREFTDLLQLNPPATWPRQYGDTGIEPADYDPIACNLKKDPAEHTNYADQFVCVIQQFHLQYGICGTLLPFAAWSDEAWPFANPTYRSLLVNCEGDEPADDPDAPPAPPEEPPPPPPVDEEDSGVEIELSFSDMTLTTWTGVSFVDNGEDLILGTDSANKLRGTISDKGLSLSYPFAIPADTTFSVRVDNFSRGSANFASLVQVGLRQGTEAGRKSVDVEVNTLGGVRLTYRGADDGVRLISTASSQYRFPICLTVSYVAGQASATAQSRCIGAVQNLGNVSITFTDPARVAVNVWGRAGGAVAVVDQKRLR